MILKLYGYLDIEPAYRRLRSIRTHLDVKRKMGMCAMITTRVICDDCVNSWTRAYIKRPSRWGHPYLGATILVNKFYWSAFTMPSEHESYFLLAEQQHTHTTFVGRCEFGYRLYIEPFSFGV